VKKFTSKPYRTTLFFIIIPIEGFFCVGGNKVMQEKINDMIAALRKDGNRSTDSLLDQFKY
jgi:hypothetical protein